MKKISLIINGGTLTLMFALATATLVYATDLTPSSALTKHISKTAQSVDASITETTVLSYKDSRDIQPEDRAELVKTINASENTTFLIVHGSTTMKETAAYLSENVNDFENKTFIFVSSDYAFCINDEKSDATANLDAAVTAAATNEPGIYFCTNEGKVVVHDKTTTSA